MGKPDETLTSAKAMILISALDIVAMSITHLVLSDKPDRLTYYRDSMIGIIVTFFITISGFFALKHTNGTKRKVIGLVIIGLMIFGFYEFPQIMKNRMDLVYLKYNHQQHIYVPAYNFQLVQPIIRENEEFFDHWGNYHRVLSNKGWNILLYGQKRL